MRIAIASGKGGTGKTTIAASIALSMAEQRNVRYIDCDVEAPNGHLLLNPAFHEKTEAIIRIPKIQIEKCTVCGKCVQVCQFHALARIGKNILVFPQLCHGCGSCTFNCPEEAIIETLNPIGMLENGMTQTGIQFFQGLLTISEPMPTPIIRQLKKMVHPIKTNFDILDSPPGASCSVVETLRGVDFVLLVTEPTPFGLHDLKQIVGILREMNIPAGVIINREGIGDARTETYCAEENLPVLLHIPFDRHIAEGLAQGKNLVDIYPEYAGKFRTMVNQIQEMI